MPFFLKPWPIVLAVLCGWVNEHQQRTIAFQNAQIAVLLEKLGQKHVLLADDQRRDLAASRLGSEGQGTRPQIKKQ